MNYVQTVIRALATSMGARALSMGLRFITVCLFPFWLSPAQVGFAAVLMALINLIIAFIDLGFGTALIKEKNVTERMGRSVFTLLVAVATIVTAVCILFTDTICAQFSLPSIALLIALFAIPFSVFAIVPNALLQRDLRFTSLALRDLLGEIAFSATAITLAILGFHLTCVAWALLIQRMVRWLVASFSVSFVPKLTCHRADIRQLLSFSLFQLGNISITQMANRIDTFLLSVFLPPAALGFYSQAQQLTIFPVQSMSGAVTNVFFASFSKIHADTQKIRELFLKMMRGVIFFALVLFACLYPAVGLIPVIYGDAWQSSVEIARMLSFSVPLFAAATLEGILISVGGEKRRLAASLTRALLMTGGLLFLFLALPNDATPNAVAIIVFFASAAAFALNFSFLIKKIGIRARDARSWLKPAALGMLLSIASIILTRIFLI